MTQSYGNASASSTSSLSGSFPDTEDDHSIASILTITEEEKSQVVKKLGSRLSHLDSIPHAPRVNREIPNVNDATLDHERLSERLAAYGLAELQIAGDGNCQFRALSDQLFRNPNHHKHMRKQVVKQLKHFRKFYESYVPMKYNSYLKQMKKSGEWGDHVTLQAAADRRFGLVSGVKFITIHCMPLKMFPQKFQENGIGFSEIVTYHQEVKNTILHPIHLCISSAIDRKKEYSNTSTFKLTDDDVVS